MKKKNNHREATIALLWLLNNTRRIVSAVYTENFEWLEYNYEKAVEDKGFTRIESTCERNFDGFIISMDCSYKRGLYLLHFHSEDDNITFRAYYDGRIVLSMILPLIFKVDEDMLTIVNHSTEELYRLDYCVRAFRERINKL